jgi:hypothetical protein
LVLRVKVTRIAIKKHIEHTIIGIGFFNSLNSGAKEVNPLAVN